MLMLFWSRESVQATAILISNPSVATKDARTVDRFRTAETLYRFHNNPKHHRKHGKRIQKSCEYFQLGKAKEYFPLAGRPARTLASSAKKREAESVTM